MFKISLISRVRNHLKRDYSFKRTKLIISILNVLIDIKGDFAWKKLSSSLDAGAKVYG